MEFGEWIGKNCRVKIRNIDVKEFSAEPLLSISQTHITIRDKFGKVLSFHLDSVDRIKETEEQ